VVLSISKEAEAALYLESNVAPPPPLSRVRCPVRVGVGGGTGVHSILAVIANSTVLALPSGELER
jgi:hypothetical protein